MEALFITLGWIGIYAPVALGAAGSILGCSRGGQAACGAMLETESGHGKFVGASALPSSQIIYGIVVMLQLARDVTLENAPALFALGVLSGVALLLSAALQGTLCASAINASKSKDEIFGMSMAPVAVVEGFAVFAFVFALVIVGNIPGGV